jgi:hypothetical protein
MATALLAPTVRRAGRRSGSALAAVVLVLDGCQREWRAEELRDDPDVTAWARIALTSDAPDYASLWWSDLESIRSLRS